MQEIQLSYGVIINWIVLHVGSNFLLDSHLTENIFKNHTEKYYLFHTGTKQGNISDYFILVMPRPIEKCMF